MDNFWQLDSGALIAGIAAVVVTIILARVENRHAKRKQLQDWRMPMYEEIIQDLAKVDESILRVVNSEQLPYGSIDHRTGKAMNNKEVNSINKTRDRDGALALEELITLRSKISASRLKLLTVDTSEVDQCIRAFLDVFMSVEFIARDKMYWILYHGWIKEMREASLSLVEAIRNEIDLKATGPVRPELNEYEAFKEISHAVKSHPHVGNLPTNHIKRLLRGELLQMETGNTVGWFKVPGYPGELAVSSINEKIDISKKWI